MEMLEKTQQLINLIQQQQRPNYSEVLKMSCNNNIELLIINPKITNQNSTVTKEVLLHQISYILK